MQNQFYVHFCIKTAASETLFWSQHGGLLGNMTSLLPIFIYVAPFFVDTSKTCHTH